jgi:hypothetical protein
MTNEWISTPNTYRDFDRDSKGEFELSVQTGAEEGTLHIGTELDESVVGNSLSTGSEQNGSHFCLQWTGLEGRMDLFEGKGTCACYLQRRKNLGWDECPTGHNGPGIERTPGSPLDGQVVRDEGQQQNHAYCICIGEERATPERHMPFLRRPFRELEQPETHLPWFRRDS